jgi:hypothetical protein
MALYKMPPLIELGIPECWADCPSCSLVGPIYMGDSRHRAQDY